MPPRLAAWPVWRPAPRSACCQSPEKFAALGMTAGVASKTAWDRQMGPSGDPSGVRLSSLPSGFRPARHGSAAVSGLASRVLPFPKGRNIHARPRFIFSLWTQSLARDQPRAAPSFLGPAFYPEDEEFGARSSGPGTRTHGTRVPPCHASQAMTLPEERSTGP